MKFIKREIDAHTLTINGVEYPAIYTFTAMKIQEDITKEPHMVTINRIARGVATAVDISATVYSMLAAAGVECTYEDICNSLVFGDEMTLTAEVLDILNSQLAKASDDETEGDSKNAEGVATEDSTP